MSRQGEQPVSAAKLCQSREAIGGNEASPACEPGYLPGRYVAQDRRLSQSETSATGNPSAAACS
jgi:hypothetical protein